MKKTFVLFLCSVITVSSCFMGGCTKKDALSLNNKEKLKKITLPKEKDNTIDLSLYFDNSTNDKKADVLKEERLISKEEVLGELIIQELIKGPSVSSKSKPILPKETRLISFSIKEGIAYVNLSKEAAVSMTIAKEEACLKSIIYSLCDLSSIQKVMIQLDNKNVETLGGHFNISNPLGKDDIENARKK